MWWLGPSLVIPLLMNRSSHNLWCKAIDLFILFLIWRFTCNNQTLCAWVNDYSPQILWCVIIYPHPQYIACWTRTITLVLKYWSALPHCIDCNSISLLAADHLIYQYCWEFHHCTGHQIWWVLARNILCDRKNWSVKKDFITLSQEGILHPSCTCYHSSAHNI